MQIVQKALTTALIVILGILALSFVYGGIAGLKSAALTILFVFLVAATFAVRWGWKRVESTAPVWVPWLVTALAEGRFAKPIDGEDKRTTLERLIGIVVNRRNWGFTGIREGYAKLVLDSAGKAVRLLMNYKGQKFDQNWVVRDVKTVEDQGDHQDYSWKSKAGTKPGTKIWSLELDDVDFKANNKPRLHKMPWRNVDWITKNIPKGYFWIGNPFQFKIDERWFRWKSLRQHNEKIVIGVKNEEGEIVESVERTPAGDIVMRKKLVDDILLQTDNYPIVVKGADTGKNESFQVDAVFIATVRIVNPWLALTRVQEWFEIFDNRMMGACRHWISNNSYEAGKAMEEGTNRENDPVLESARGTVDRLEYQFGIRVQDIALPSFELAGDETIRKEQYRALQAKFIANRQKDATVIAAKAESARRKIVAEGEAASIATEAAAYEKAGEVGERFLAAKVARELASGQATKIVIPSLDSLIAGLLGGQKKLTDGKKEE